MIKNNFFRLFIFLLFSGIALFYIAKSNETRSWPAYTWSTISFRYPPDWQVDPIYYRTPAQEANNEPADQIGLAIHPISRPFNGDISYTDMITVGGRQKDCSNPNGNYVRCVDNNTLPM